MKHETVWREIAGQVGTPVYVYDTAVVQTNARAYQPPFLNAKGHAHYAIKANNNLHLLRLIQQLGLGADVTSEGELFLALKAGFDPAHIIFSGVGKTAAEIRLALQTNIQALHAESATELELIRHTAADMNVVARVGLRLNPNISAETHPYISTGLQAHKFGVPLEEGIALYRQMQDAPHLRPVGVAAHIGSQIRDLAPFAQTAELLADIATELRTAGLPIEYVDVGGGWGIPYQSEPELEPDAPRIGDWVQTVSQPVLAAGFKLVMEPGRSVIGSAGLLLTRVIRLKQQGAKTFAIVDTGMSDLLRPTLYGAYHHIELVGGGAEEGGDTAVYDVVGPICESGDFLAQGRPLPALQAGDLLLVRDTGAYGFAMSSNYNGRVRPAEVLLEDDGQAWRLIRRRQGLEALLDGIV